MPEISVEEYLNQVRPLIRLCVREVLAVLHEENKLSDQLLTVAQTSKLLGMSKRFVYNNKKKLGCLYLFNRPMFRASKINELLNEPDKHLQGKTWNFQKKQ